MSMREKLSCLLLPAPVAPYDYPFVASDVAQYQRCAHPEDSVLDSQTWNDLLAGAGILAGAAGRANALPRGHAGLGAPAQRAAAAIA